MGVIVGQLCSFWSKGNALTRPLSEAIGLWVREYPLGDLGRLGRHACALEICNHRAVITTLSCPVEWLEKAVIG